MTKTEKDISLNPSLLDRLKAMALEMKISQTKLLALAVEEFLERQQTRKLVDSINQAYQDGPDEEDREWLAFAQESMRRLNLEDPW